MDRELDQNRKRMDEIVAEQTAISKKIIYIFMQSIKDAHHSECRKGLFDQFIASNLAESQYDSRLSPENKRAIVEHFEKLRDRYLHELKIVEIESREAPRLSLYNSVDELIARFRNELSKGPPISMRQNLPLCLR